MLSWFYSVRLLMLLLLPPTTAASRSCLRCCRFRCRCHRFGWCFRCRLSSLLCVGWVVFFLPFSDTPSRCPRGRGLRPSSRARLSDDTGKPLCSPPVPYSPCGESLCLRNKRKAHGIERSSPPARTSEVQGRAPEVRKNSWKMIFVTM